VEFDSPHLPHQAPIESFRGGGFRFAGMSHRGALVCLPDGVWAAPVTRPQEIDEQALRLIFAAQARIELCIIGTGAQPWLVPAPLRQRCRDAGFTIEAMTTAPAVHTYNILVEEKRRVAALLIPLD
jgi:uncharacterized protein